MIGRAKSIALVLIAVIALMVPAAAFAAEGQGDWVGLETAHFKISAPERANVRSIGKTAESLYDDMAARYHFTMANDKISLYVYTNQTAFLSASPSADAAGYASPSEDSIAILEGAGNSTVTLAHEINHIMLMTSVPQIDTVPEWFIEGLAVYESQPGVEATALEKYALARDIPELVGVKRDADSGPATPQDYAEGYMMVNFIVDLYGKPKLYKVISNLQSGDDFNSALVGAIGIGAEALNASWQTYNRRQQLLIFITQFRDFGWYLMGAVVILVMIVAPIKKRRRLRAMEDDEEQDDLAQTDSISP